MPVRSAAYSEDLIVASYIEELSSPLLAKVLRLRFFALADSILRNCVHSLVAELSTIQVCARSKCGGAWSQSICPPSAMTS